MEIVPYTLQMQAEWDEFVSRSKNGTLFHTRKFLSYHPEDRFEDRSVLFMDKKGIAGVFACNVSGSKIMSHSGSTSGGLIVRENNTLKDSVSMFTLLSAHFNGYPAVSFRKHEYVFDRLPSQEVEFAATRAGFRREFEELSTALFLPSYSLPKALRNMHAQSRKVLEIVWDDQDYDKYHELLSVNLEKYAAKPTHTLAEMQSLKQRFPSSYFLVTGRLDGELVCGTWVVLPARHAAHTFYIALDYKYKKYNPLVNLIDHVAKKLAADGYGYLNFGISTENAGTVVNEGLVFFKERFGGHGLTRQFYSLTR